MGEKHKGLAFVIPRHILVAATQLGVCRTDGKHRVQSVMYTRTLSGSIAVMICVNDSYNEFFCKNYNLRQSYINEIVIIDTKQNQF